MDSRVWGPAGVNTWADIHFYHLLNDMQNAVSSARIATFADDSKCYRIIESDLQICNRI